MVEIDDVTIKRAACGSSRAFKALYECYAPFLWKVIYRTIQADPHAAAEVLQQSYIRAYSALKKFKFDSAFSTWLYRITYNTALTYVIKAQKRNQRHTQLSEIAQDKAADRLSDKDMVSRIFAGLSAEERFVLTAREISGLTYEEIADIVGKAPGALRTAMHRLKARLREEYKYEYQS
ncbi:MAG: sigma-70 family RNA polymerase sigma factor [Chitinivibrionales bacterium]|nr:sigma-70 family RNA polymerase sigma factor [Chitinivibrionales bacterium]